MSRRRTQRNFEDADRAALLAAIGQCRQACIAACIAACRQAPINGDVYRGASRVMAAIDEMAGVLTGDREHFHLPAHNAGPTAPK